jgi:DNA primase
MYSKKSLELLRQRIDLVEVISPFVKFSRSGTLFKGLCPFHDEKTPSFIIQRGDTHYHCYGCSAHGDAIEFLMNSQKMSFVDAIEYLAEKFGILLEKEDSQTPKIDVNKPLLKEALLKASQFFQFYLLHTKDGQEALKYLYGRGYDLNFIKIYGLGFAPKNGEMFLKAMQEQKIDEKTLFLTGLLKKSQYGKTYPFFTDRITIPINDNFSSVIGFSSRKFKEDTFGPKYINSPETYLFKKSKMLFGMSYSRKKIAKQKKAILVEGQFDALSLIYYGFGITVASQGTAFGNYHAKQLVDLGINKVYIAFDSDTAGIEAAVKIGHMFQKMSIEAYITKMPPGKDPDSILKEGKKKELISLFEQSQDYLTFLIETFSKNADMNSPSEKSRLVLSIADRIKKWDDPLMVHESLKKLAKLTNTSNALIGTDDFIFENIQVYNSQRADVGKIDQNHLLEKAFITHLFSVGNVEQNIINLAKQNICPNDLRIPFLKNLYEKYLLLHECDKPRDFLSLTIEFDQKEQRELLAKIFEIKQKREIACLAFVKVVMQIMKRNWLDKRAQLSKKIADSNLSVEKSLELAKEFDELKNNPPEIVFPKGSEGYRKLIAQKM